MPHWSSNAVNPPICVGKVPLRSMSSSLLRDGIGKKRGVEDST